MTNRSATESPFLAKNIRGGAQDILNCRQGREQGKTIRPRRIFKVKAAIDLVDIPLIHLTTGLPDRCKLFISATSKHQTLTLLVFVQPSNVRSGRPGPGGHEGHSLTWKIEVGRSLSPASKYKHSTAVVLLRSMTSAPNHDLNLDGGLQFFCCLESKTDWRSWNTRPILTP